MDCLHNYGLKVGNSPSLDEIWSIFQAATANMAHSGTVPKGLSTYWANAAGDKSDFFPTVAAKCRVGRRVYNFFTGQTLGWKNYGADII
jgi:hypothetical protein